MVLSSINGGLLTFAGLALIMALVLILPFSVKKIEEELEAFLFLMGVSAVSFSHLWSWHLIREALCEPVAITLVVFFVGLLFRKYHMRVAQLTKFMTDRLGVELSVFLIIAALGFLSSVITAIIAALILAEVVSAFSFDRDYEIKFVVYACFAIGLGAALTPLGEPLSTIVVSKLKGPPHNADFYFLFKMLWKWVVPGVLVFAFLATRHKGRKVAEGEGLHASEKESMPAIAARAVKVYLFVMALMFLGAGLKPLAESFIVLMPDGVLFWLNSASAVLDNATLAASEITPSMPAGKIKYLLLGLLVSGGMLIPGNIPNIISASKLGIKSREWAKVGLPVGGMAMLVCFLLLTIFA